MPRVVPARCIGCCLCVRACPVKAIALDTNKKAVIDGSRCLECGVCIRICPTNAVEFVEPPYPLKFKVLSNPAPPKITGIPGRGTDEVKTNDVTGRYRRGEVGFTIDVGRPNVGTTLADVVKILRKLEEVGVELERENPQMLILEDLRSGRLSYEDLEGIRIMSVVLEGKTSLSNLPRVIKALRDVEKEVNTVFSVGVICRFEDDMSIPCLKVLEELGVTPMPFAKINLGLGRPLVTD